MKLKPKARSSNCMTDARAALLPDYGMPDHGSSRPFFYNSTAALINRPPRLAGNLARARLAPFLAVTLLLLLGPSARAQETSTEREAAREVLRKMDALEKSIAPAEWVAKLTGSDAARDQVVARARELMDKELLALADDITRNPEIGFVEHRSIAKLIDYLKQHDFEVTLGAGGLETAFVGVTSTIMEHPIWESSWNTRMRCT